MLSCPGKERQHQIDAILLGNLARDEGGVLSICLKDGSAEHKADGDGEAADKEWLDADRAERGCARAGRASASGSVLGAVDSDGVGWASAPCGRDEAGASGRGGDDVGAGGLRATLETMGLASAVLEEGLGIAGACWELAAGEWLDVPVFARFWALLLRGGTVSTTVAAWVFGAGESLLEQLHLVTDRCDGVALDADQTVAVGGLGEHVHETTGDGAGHVAVVQSLRLGKGAGIGHTTVLGKAVDG